MPDETWDAGRIAEYRALARAQSDTGVGSGFTPQTVLSLLNELESVTSQRDAMRRRAEAAEADWQAALLDVERVTKERDAMRNEIILLRATLDDYMETYE